MKFDIKNIVIDKNQVVKFLGYANRNIPAIILKKIDEEIESSYSLFEPLVFLKHFQIDEIIDGEVTFGVKYKIKSDYVADELKESSSIYVLLYTIGDKIEAKIKEHSKTSEMIRAMILDKIGVVALDNINKQIKEKIINEIVPNKISSQLYPAQKDFLICNQKIIFDIFEKENDVITISKHYQFNPLKTVAVLLGIGKDEDKHNMCDRCESKCFSSLI
ncbi:hypothetical protein [uncultured Clostridium sp.]|uniref:hypothetical protein n=1 Tax=uncultured Clostridium sp. TaxID=59620 RepID=UPI003217205B